MKKLPALLSAVILIFTFVLTSSCSGGGTENTVGVSDAAETETQESAAVIEGYQYYDGADLGGKTFTYFNVPKYVWDLICVICPDEITGESVNDGIYERNEYVKSKLNCDIKELNHEDDSGKMLDSFRKLILAGDDSIQAAYLPMNTISAAISENLLYRLNGIETIHLDQDYWDQELISGTAVRGSNYFATGNAHLESFDGIWCAYFNKDMADNLQLEYPYELVRDGKWTLDKLSEYSKAAANLNGDEKFVLDISKNAVFGCVSYSNVIMKFLHGFNADFMVLGDNGEPKFNADSSRFINASQKLAEYFAADGLYLNASANHSDKNLFFNFFEAERAMFILVELNYAQILRPMEFSFGIVPLPKLNEQQESYHSTILHQCGVFTIPATNSNPEEIGLVTDALSYESTERVVEPYFSEKVEQKGLRDEESIEMLHIINKSKSFDIGVAYQWVSNLETDIRQKLAVGNGDIVSTVEKGKEAVIEKMQETLSYFK